MKLAVRNLRRADGNLHQYVYYWCGGCECAHSIPAERWNWNKSTESPTLSPSVRHFIPAMGGRPEVTTCHYHLKEGILEYCDDCPHSLKGQKVPLQDIPDDYGLPGDDL